MQILFGVYGMGEAEAKAFVDLAVEYGVDVESYACKYSKLGVMQFLGDNPETDVVILSESLEGKSPYDVADFERIVDAYERVVIIPILNAETAGTDKARDIFNLGIYNGLFGNDATAENVAKLIKEGRPRRLAKTYYHIPETDSSFNGADIGQCISYIEEGEIEEIGERARYIYERVKPSDFIMIKQALPEEMQRLVEAAVEENRVEFNMTPADKCEDDLEEEVTTSDSEVATERTASSVLSALWKKTQEKFSGNIAHKEKDKSEEEEGRVPVEPDKSVITSDGPQGSVALKDVLSNVAIAFLGTQRKSGCTHQAIIAAHYLHHCGYRVAIEDCTGTKGKVFQAIARYCTVEERKGFFSYRGVDYYAGSVPELQDGYHFIVKDYGVFNQNIKEDVARCAHRFVVSGSMPWEQGALNAFINEAGSLNEGLHYLIRGGARSEWARSFASGRENLDIRAAEVQEDAFSGMCYPAMSDILSVYVQDSQHKGLGAVSAGKSGRNEVKLVGTATCFVSSLKRGCGATYFAASVANHLARRYETCLLTSNPGVLDYALISRVNCGKLNGSYDLTYGDNEFLVFDGGVYRDLADSERAECRRANYKIMMCWADDAYMEELARFVAAPVNRAEEWVYVFNNVPDSRIAEIQKLMSAHFTCYLPVYDAKAMPRIVHKMIDQIIS